MTEKLGLSYNTRKALSVQMGETAGCEVANVLQQMAARIEELKRCKVNVTPLVPENRQSTSQEEFSDLEQEK